MFKLSAAAPVVKVPEIKMPTLLISPQAYVDMLAIVNRPDTDEIGWLGMVDKVDDVHFRLTRVFVPEQTVQPSETEITEQGVADIAETLISEPDGLASVSKLRLWGHSHVNMGVTPSTPDRTQWATFMKDCDDFFFMLIANKKGDLFVAYVNLEHGIEVDNCKWHLDYDMPAPSQDWEAVCKAASKYKAITYTGGYHQQGGLYESRWKKKDAYEFRLNNMPTDKQSITNNTSTYICTYLGLRKTCAAIAKVLDTSFNSVVAKQILTDCKVASYMPVMSANNAEDDIVCFPGWRMPPNAVESNYSTDRHKIDIEIINIGLVIHMQGKHTKDINVPLIADVYANSQAIPYEQYIRTTHPVYLILLGYINSIDEYPDYLESQQAIAEAGAFPGAAGRDWY